MKRWAKVTAVMAVLVGTAYLLGMLGRSTVAVPPDFKEARTQGAVISESIVSISNQITADLGRVNDLESERKVEEAAALAGDLLARSEEVKRQANDLAEQLGKMTGALADIKDPEARRLALEAITGRLALISRLISYSDYLAELLMNLKNRLAGLPYTENTHILVSQINAEVIAINNFNRQAADAMAEFDKMIK